MFPLTQQNFNSLFQAFKSDYFAIDSSISYLNGLKKIGNLTYRGVITVALCVSTVALPIFLAIDLTVAAYKWIRKKISKSYPEDCYYLFNSSVFSAYFSQLQAFLKQQIGSSPQLSQTLKESKPFNLFQGEVLALLNHILKSNPLSEKERRVFHQTMIDLLRSSILENQIQEMLLLDPLSQEMTRLLEKICEWIYTESYLLDEMANFIDEQTKPSMIRQIDSLTSIQSIYNNLLQKNEKFKGLSPHVTRLDDPHRLGDLPSFLYSISTSTGKNVKMIRTASVVKEVLKSFEKKSKDIVVIEEFLWFLKSYQKQNKKHLYINLMYRYGSVEGVRSRQIELLDTNQKYQNGIDVITLSKDGDFYWQRNQFYISCNTEKFKADFMYAMFEDPSTHFYWSKSLNLTEWKVKCALILNRIHLVHFNNKDNLNHQERLDFIELVYADIIQDLNEQLSPDSCNIACRSCVDRGGAANGLQYLKYFKSSNRLITSSDVRKTTAMTLAPAILVMNRMIFPTRFPRFNTARQKLIQI